MSTFIDTARGMSAHVPVRIGDLVLSETWCQKRWPGMAPSRENAYIMRLLDVTENVPQKNIAPMTMTWGRAQRAGMSAPTLLQETDWSTYHEDDRALLADGVEKDLRDRLAGRGVQGRVEVLDGEQQAEDEEPAEYGRDPDGHDDPEGARHRCVMCLFGHLAVVLVRRGHSDRRASIRTCALPSKPADYPSGMDVPGREVNGALLTCDGVLRHERADDDNIRRARALAPSNSVDARVVDKGLEHELCRLVARRRREDGDDDRRGPDGVPPDGDVVDVLEQVHAERVDEPLADEHPGVYADRDTWCRDEARAQRRGGADEVGHGKTGSVCQECALEESVAPSMTHLMPVVTATWPSRLNQPVTQDAKAAC